MTAAVITLSDKGFKGERKDESGPILADLLKNEGYTVIYQKILPDEKAEIEKELIYICDELQANLVLTTGGTGFSARDNTPEATLAVMHKNANGIAEAIRAYSMTITKRAMLSRGASVIRGQSLIVNMPGSPKAATECANYILPQLSHGLKVLIGEDGECARK